MNQYKNIKNLWQTKPTIQMRQKNWFKGQDFVIWNKSHIEIEMRGKFYRIHSFNIQVILTQWYIKIYI